MLSSSGVRQKFFQAAEIFHLRIFGHEMSDEMRKFLGNLSWSFFGGIFFGGIFLIIHVLAGRWLGPIEYGKFNLSLVIAQIFFIPMVFGFDQASLRAISQKRGDIDFESIVSSSLFFVVIQSLLVGFLLLHFSEKIAIFLSTSNKLVIASTFFGFLLSIKLLLESFIRGLHLFKRQSIVKIVESCSIMVIFLFFIFYLENTSYTALIFSMILATIITSAVYFQYLFTFIEKIDLAIIKELFIYAKFVFAGSVISMIFTQGDKLLVNKYIGQYELGVYTAYSTISILVISQLISIISNVFLPAISSSENKMGILIKIDRMMVRGVVPAIFLLTLFIVVSIKIFGSAYPLIWQFVILFSTIGVLQLFASFYSSVVSIHSEKTYYWGLVFFIIRLLIYIVYISILVYFDIFSVTALLIGLLFNSIFDIINLRYVINKYAT